MDRLQAAIEQIQRVRGYTARLIDHTDPDQWFWQPAGGVTHLAWQVGHLAMAQYRLLLERLRGVRPGDDDLIPPEYFTLFGKDSTPDPDPERSPSPKEIRSVFDRVYAQALIELPGVVDADLDQAPLRPHPLFNTKYESLIWSANHELIHAGQIGLLRRLQGQAPLW